MPIASIDELHVGQVVDVAARTGPGMNKLGGAARVTAIHSQMNAVDIKCASIASERWSQVYDRSRPCRYMLDNRTEKKLDLQCVSCRSTCTVSSCAESLLLVSPACRFISATMAAGISRSRRSSSAPVVAAKRQRQEAASPARVQSGPSRQVMPSEPSVNQRRKLPAPAPATLKRASEERPCILGSTKSRQRPSSPLYCAPSSPTSPSYTPTNSPPRLRTRAGAFSPKDSQRCSQCDCTSLGKVTSSGDFYCDDCWIAYFIGQLYVKSECEGCSHYDWGAWCDDVFYCDTCWVAYFLGDSAAEAASPSGGSPTCAARVGQMGRSVTSDKCAGLIEKIASELGCPICQELLVHPCVLAVCGHMFCFACLHTAVSRVGTRRRTPTCPTCRCHIESPPAPSYAVRQVIMHMANTGMSSEHAARLRQRAAEAEQYIQAAGDRPWESVRPVTIFDQTDGVVRCAMCHCEVDPGLPCENCCGALGPVRDDDPSAPSEPPGDDLDDSDSIAAEELGTDDEYESSFIDDGSELGSVHGSGGLSDAASDDSDLPLRHVFPVDAPSQRRRLRRCADVAAGGSDDGGSP